MRGVGQQTTGAPGGGGRERGRGARRNARLASAACRHGVNHALVLEEHRKAVVVPARDRRLADGGMAVDGRAEMLLDLLHRAAALGTINLRFAHLDLIVDDDGLGERGAREGATAQHHSANSGRTAYYSYAACA